MIYQIRYILVCIFYKIKRLLLYFVAFLLLTNKQSGLGKGNSLLLKVCPFQLASNVCKSHSSNDKIQLHLLVQLHCYTALLLSMMLK